MRFTRYGIFLCLALPMVFGFNLGAANRVIRGSLFPAHGETQLPDRMTITLSRQGALQTAMSRGAGSFSFENVSEGEYPSSHYAHNAPGILSTRSKRLKEVREELTRAVEIEPDSPAAHRNLGLVMLLQNEPATAIGPLLAATTLDKSDARAHAYLGEAYFQTGQLNEARQTFERCLVLDPTVGVVAFRLGEICARTSQHRQALAYFKQVLKQNPPPELAAAAEANIEKLQSMVH